MSQFQLRTIGEITTTNTLLIPAPETQRIVAALRGLPAGSKVKVEYTLYNEKKDKERARTEAQNRYYHKLLDIVCAHTGYRHDELHKELKVMFLSRPWIKGDREYTLVSSTRDLKNKEFSDYLEKVFQWAGETFGLVLPDSSEYYT